MNEEDENILTWEQQVEWSKHHFQRMNIGATWAVPRTGLIFNKQDNQTLALILMAPVELPEHREFQRNDYACIKKRMEAAGVTVIDKTGDAE